MGLNDDQLSATEHDAMRARLLAGSRRIKPAGAHRRAIITTTVAVALVAGLSAAAVGSANFLRADDQIAPITTPSPTPSATPTPTPTQTAETPTPTPTSTAPSGPVAPTIAFAGDCDNALSAEEATAVVGIATERTAMHWTTGAVEVLGGLYCQWTDASPSPTPELALAVYPDSSVPAAYRSLSEQAECSPVEGFDPSYRRCALARTVGSTWFALTASPAPADPSALDAAAETVASRLSRFPAPVPTERAASWWNAPDCAALDSAVDVASAFGFDSQTLDPTSGAPGPLFLAGIPTTAGAEVRCGWTLSPSRGASVRLVPGGAHAFETIAALEDAEPIVVPGAAAAVTVRDDFLWEGHFPALVVTDGANLMVVQPTGTGWEPDFPLPSVAVPVASQLLAALG